MSGTTFLERLAGYRLPGASPWTDPLAPGDVASSIRACRQHNLVGLLDQAVADGAVDIDSSGAALVGEAAADVAAWSLLVERHHLGVHHQLVAASIEHGCLKGPGYAHRFYAHPALRPFRDVDVLVRGADLPRALAVLGAGGHRRVQPDAAPGFIERYGKSVTLRSEIGEVEVDVHRSLSMGPFGVRASPEPLMAHLVSLPIGGRELPVLDVAASFVHACVHATTAASVRLGTLRDVAQIHGAVGDHDEVRELAERLGVGACVAVALRTVTDRLGVAFDSPMSGWGVSDRERRWLEVYVAQGRSERALAISALGAVPGLAGKVRYGLSLARAGFRRSRGATTATVQPPPELR